MRASIIAQWVAKHHCHPLLSSPAGAEGGRGRKGLARTKLQFNFTVDETEEKVVVVVVMEVDCWSLLNQR